MISNWFSVDPVSQSDRKSCADSVYYVDKIFIQFDDTVHSAAIVFLLVLQLKNPRTFPIKFVTMMESIRVKLNLKSL